MVPEGCLHMRTFQFYLKEHCRFPRWLNTFLGEKPFQHPLEWWQNPTNVMKGTDCYRQLNSSSLHKQTRRNPLSGDVCSPVEDHDLVPSLPDNLKSQTHSRVSECDDRPSVQVKPVNRMATASAGIQTDLSQVVHSSCRSVCHLSEPQSSTVHISSPRHRCSEHKLVGSHCLC